MSEQIPIELGVTEFVDLLNQSLDMAFGGVVITGELANLRVSKNRWVYFDLKDDESILKFFGNVYQLPGPLEDGMVLKVRGTPRLHNLYGFSVNVSSIQLAGEGTIKRAAELLKAKLTAEGLFDPSRKRILPYPPSKIGLITSKQSAAYGDFIKIINARWQGLTIELIDVQVQGEIAPTQITEALEQFNSNAQPPDTVVIIRGGGSAEDLAAFSSEQVTRAVAASRVPTLVAIGHEIDLSLAEMAADQRASTPSNAAELLVPDRQQVLLGLSTALNQIEQAGQKQIQQAKAELKSHVTSLEHLFNNYLSQTRSAIKAYSYLLAVLNPASVLKRGYAIVRLNKQAIRSIKLLNVGDALNIQFADGFVDAEASKIYRGSK